MILTARNEKQLGEAIRRTRKKKGLTQKDISARTNLRPATISSLENGDAGTQLKTIFRVLEALELEFELMPRQKPGSVQLEDLLQ
ncbi:helix-turn-helix transcriptional regulator [uncultured Kiloniella sp.]|uniref:helix-turn-helix domain-containing protein n=1 Tax=uncultured Kiloniella sp. TaxID=1133091 RepID=UPI0026148D52|nr:helix-turn-helix transcriptional regulator [uncultured Kiloniella sp.]